MRADAVGFGIHEAVAVMRSLAAEAKVVEAGADSLRAFAKDSDDLRTVRLVTFVSRVFSHCDLNLILSLVAGG